MHTIKLSTLDELYFLIEELKTVIYLCQLIEDEKNECSIEGFEKSVGFADYYLLKRASELILNLSEMVSGDDFTQKI